MKKAKTARKNMKPSKRSSGKNKIHLAAGALVTLLFAVGALGFTNHAGPLNAAFSSVFKIAPAAQQDTTKLYTADGLASSTTILVKFKSSVPAATVAAIHKQEHASVKQTVADIGVQEVSLPSGASVGDTLQQYRAHGEVEYAEPNFVAQRFLTPNDTLYGKEWNLAKIGAPAAWDDSQGGYGPVAIIDTGIDAQHSDLAGEVGAGYNFVNGSTDTNDDNGHGTHVAGIIAAVTNNTNGVASIGFKGTLMPVKVLDSTGSGTYAAVANGIIYAADHGAKIINMSLGGSSASRTLESAVSYAEQKGVIVVAAAGNNGNSAAVYPADYPGVVAVSATTSSDGLAAFSSYGSNIFVSAPGVGIISTYNNGGYATMSGTSMAAPEVSGLIGLALSHGQVSGAAILSDLKTTSDKVGPYPYDSNGWNQYFGYGRIDAGKLLQLIAGTPAPAPPAPTAAPEGQAVHGQQAAEFSVDFEGTVDSVDPAHGIVNVKIQSISQNLKTAANNLVSVFVTNSTTIKDGNQSLQLGNLAAGDKLSGKALWQNNQLSAVTLTVQGHASGGAASSQAPSGDSGSGSSGSHGQAAGHSRRP